MRLRAPGRGACLLAGLVASLPLVAFVVTQPPASLLFLAASLLGITLIRPHYGWLVLAGLAPFGALVGRLTAYRWTATEPLVLSFLCGWFLSETFRRDDAVGEGGWAQAPLGLASLMALGVLASLAVQLVVLQVSTAFPLDFARLVWRFLWHDYYGNVDLLPAVPGAAFVLEGIALYAASAVLLARVPGFALTGARVFVGSAASVAAINAARLVHDAASATRSAGLGTLLATRISVVFPDVNAAGSYFVLALFLASALAVSARRYRGAWYLAAFLAVVGLVLAGSRTAFAAAWLAAGGLAVALRRRSRAAARAVLPALIGLGVLAGAYAVWSPRSNPLDMETGVRWRNEMLATSLRVVREYPVFGIGAGRFYEESSRFRSADWATGTPRENAHNNFLQVLAELGVVGLVLLTALLAVILHRAWRRIGSWDDTWVAGLFGGIVAFVLTWFAGHPLLVREVSLAFWLALGLLTAGAAGDAGQNRVSVRRHPGRRALPFTVAALLIVALVPVTAERRLARADLTRDGRGFSQWHIDPDGTRFRWMLKRAVLYVPASATQVVIGLRSPGGLATVRLLVEGKQAAQVVVGKERWEGVRVAVPQDYGWASVPVTLQVRGSLPADSPESSGAAERRIQVTLPQVLSASPPKKP